MDEAALSQRAEDSRIGFESQKQKKALNEARIRLTNARASHIEIDSAIRKACEAPLPTVVVSEIDDPKTKKAA